MKNPGMCEVCNYKLNCSNINISNAEATFVQSTIKEAKKIFINHQDPVMLVFTMKLFLRTPRWVPMCQGLSHFSEFLHHFVLAKLATCCCWLIIQYKMLQKKLKNDWNPGMLVLIWEYLSIAIQWIQTWQGLDDFQKYLRPCALDESSLSIERVN